MLILFFQATQVLYNYRSKFAINAIHVVLNNLCKWLNIDLSNVNNKWDELSNLAEDLLHKRRFIFKGGEPPGEVSFCLPLNMHTILITIKFRSNGRFSNVLIIETFQSHFSAYTQGQALFKTGPSFCGLAIATAAVKTSIYYWYLG